MKPISVNAARDLGKKSGARRVVIIAMQEDDFSITTWGRTRAECRALGMWADSEEAVAAVSEIVRSGQEVGPPPRDDDECPTCRGTGYVDPLTAPKDFFCAGRADCPHCDGTGQL